MTHILVFGDSITYGAWDIEGGWVGRLRKYLDQQVIDSNYQLYWIVYNLGIDGDTSSGLLKRFENEVKKRTCEREDRLIIIDIGANDSIQNNKTKKLWCATEKYEQNLKKLVELARKYTKNIVLIGPLRVDEPRVDPMPWLAGHSYKNNILIEFYKKAESIAKQENIPFVGMWNLLENKDLADGTHPTTEGHRKIFEVVKNFLVKEKMI